MEFDDWKIAFEQEIIDKEVLIRYCEMYCRQLENSSKEENPQFPDYVKMIKARVNIYKNLIGILKNGVSNEQALQCQNCNIPFTPKRKDAKFCSSSCRVQFFRKKVEGTIIYGWMHGDGKIRLWVYQNDKGWGVTEDPAKAKRFKNAHECIMHWRSKHAFPENYEDCITNGYLHIASYETGQLEFLSKSIISNLISQI